MEASAPSHELATAADLAGLEHHEIIDGHVVRKASPSFFHGFIQGELFVQLREVNAALEPFAEVTLDLHALFASQDQPQ